MLAPTYTGYVTVVTVLYSLKLSQICHTNDLVPMPAAHHISAEYGVVVIFFKVSRLAEEPLQTDVVFGANMSHARFKPTGGIPFPAAAISHTN